MKKRKWAFPLWLFINSTLLLTTIMFLHDTVFYYSRQNLIMFLLSGMLWTLSSSIIIVATYEGLSGTNNSILLATKTIERNGFHEIWRQTNSEHSIQILCFNPDTNEFRAFDRYHWMDEPFDVSYGLPEGTYYKKDLWTPIKLHFTAEWVEKHIVQ